MERQKTGIELTGQPLGFSDLVRIGAGVVMPTASESGVARVRAAREVLESTIQSGMPVYGSTTGVGAMKDVEWSPEDLDTFNLGLVRAHHFGTGAPFSMSVVRNAMAIRVNTALTGQVGCSSELIDAYLQLLHSDVIPVVRRTGSIGCADIGLMGQIGAVLTGVGEAVYHGRRMQAADAFAAAGIKPVRMLPRDSLASLSVNAVSFAAAAETTRNAASSIRVLLATGMMAAGALGSSRDPWYAVRHVGTAREALIGSWLCNASEEWPWPVATHIQDPLSLRMIGQVFGAVIENLLTAGHKILAATGRSDDNPVIVDGRGHDVGWLLAARCDDPARGCGHLHGACGAQCLQSLRPARQRSTARPACQPRAGGQNRYRLRPDHQACRRDLLAGAVHVQSGIGAVAGRGRRHGG